MCKRNLNHCDFQHVSFIFEVKEYQSIPEIANQLLQKEIQFEVRQNYMILRVPISFGDINITFIALI